MKKNLQLGEEHRDINLEIRRKNESVRVETLRKTYGENFAQGVPGDMKLDTLLESTGVNSLTEYLKRS